MLRLCCIRRRVVSFLVTLVAIPFLFCASSCFGDQPPNKGIPSGELVDVKEYNREPEYDVSRRISENWLAHLNQDSERSLREYAASYKKQHPAAQQSLCDSLTAEKEQPIQTSEQVIIAKKIIQHLRDKGMLNSTSMNEAKLFDILHNTQQKAILNAMIGGSFATSHFLSWDRMLDYFNELNITIEQLCNLGLHPDIMDGDQRTILEGIINKNSNQYDSCIDFLLQKGAIISPLLSGGIKRHDTALKIALERKSGKELNELVLKLLKHNDAAGLALNHVDRRLLAYAIERGCNAAVVELFIQQGADVNAGEWKRSTPLWAALAKGDKAFDIVEVLIKYQVDLNAPVDVNCFPLDFVSDVQSPRIAALLKQHGAKSYYTHHSNDENTSNLPPRYPENKAKVNKAIETLNKYVTEPITLETPFTKINSLYRKATLKYHPDKHLQEQEKYKIIFQELSTAFTTVSEYWEKKDKPKT